jgi:hypothetical protein
MARRTMPRIRPRRQKGDAPPAIATIGSTQLVNGKIPDARCGALRDGLLARIALAGVVTLAALASARPAHADLVVPANSVLNLAGGTVDLACTDLIVAGTLQVASGTVLNARHVTIQAGGTIDGGSGTIALGGDWTNAGQFVAGTSAVRFRDLCSLTAASVRGSTSFSTASFVTASGRNFVFDVGATQTVNAVLEIAGTASLPIQFRSAVPGQVGYINLVPSGTQLIQHVGVTDVWATGQWLAPSLTNEGGGGNANRWFGAGGAAAPIPTLADFALLALAALLAATGAWSVRRQRRDESLPNRRVR